MKCQVSSYGATLKHEAAKGCCFLVVVLELGQQLEPQSVERHIAPIKCMAIFAGAIGLVLTNFSETLHSLVVCSTLDIAKPIKH